MKKMLWPDLGCGVGLRPPHYAAILERWPKVDWFEAITENYMDSGGKPVEVLEKIRERYPVALHGVALSIGSCDPLNERYLTRLKILAERIQPAVISDHLCWSGAGGKELHDLLPLPFMEESIRHVVSRVSKVQDFLKRPILLENVSTYVTFKHSVMPEWEFLREVARRSGCGILLDLNNIYVNAKNHGFDPKDYLAGIPGEKVGQFHLAGHTDKGTYLFDTHSRPVVQEVWDLYAQALELWGRKSTLIEWDMDIPAWPRLMKECAKAEKIYIQTKKNKSGFHEPQPKSEFAATSAGSKPVQKSLKEIQLRLKSCILPSAKPRRVSSVLNPQGGAPGEKRTEVYAEGYLARMYDGLLDVCQVTHQLLGPERFFSAACLYAKKYPSQDYNLNLVGRHFSDFLRHYPIKGMPYLEDLARLERLVSESFHAFDLPSLEFEKLAAVPPSAWGRIRFHFQPSVCLLQTGWPVFEIWKDKRHRRVKPGPQQILISRQGVKVKCQLLDALAFRFLAGLMNGKTLGRVCGELSKFSKKEIPVQSWFSRWKADNLFSGFTVQKQKDGAS